MPQMIKVYGVPQILVIRQIIPTRPYVNPIPWNRPLFFLLVTGFSIYLNLKP